MRVVLPTKGDVIAVHRQKAVIRDRDAMGIAGQVLQDMLRPAEGSLGVDDPLLAKQSAQERCERLLVSQGLQIAVEGDLFLVEGPPQPGDELPAKHAAQYSHRQKEVGWRANPPRAVERQAATRYDTVDMWVALQGLSQVWRILRKPISAPRRAGSAATSSSVAALASNNRPKRSFLFCQINGTSACGTLKTTWK